MVAALYRNHFQFRKDPLTNGFPCLLSSLLKLFNATQLPCSEDIMETLLWIVSLNFWTAAISKQKNGTIHLWIRHHREWSQLCAFTIWRHMIIFFRCSSSSSLSWTTSSSSSSEDWEILAIMILVNSIIAPNPFFVYPCQDTEFDELPPHQIDYLEIGQNFVDRFLGGFISRPLSKLEP